jgi:hypothetical protein
VIEEKNNDMEKINISRHCIFQQEIKIGRSNEKISFVKPLWTGSSVSKTIQSLLSC